MKKLLRISMIAMALTLLLSCATSGVNLKGNPGVLQGYQKIAVAEIAIMPPRYTILPLIDAGIYRDAAFKVADKTIAAHESIIEPLAGDLIAKLQGSFQGTLTGGRELFGSVELPVLFKEKGIRVYGPKINFKPYPEIILPKDTPNFIDFSGTDELNINEEFIIRAHKDNFAKLCGVLDVDAVIVGLVTVETPSVAMFGINGTRILWIRLYVIDRDGNLQLMALAYGDPVTAGSQDLASYKSILLQYSKLGDLIAEKLF